MTPDARQRAREALSRARAVAVLTGAGISAESGIPTFRDALTGLWSRFRPEQLATPEAFAADPKTVWDWYAWRRELLARVEPNPGHRALAALEARVAERGGKFTLATQNVDGLHRKAGSRNVLELHGNILRTKCFTEQRPLEGGDLRPGTPPLCAHCGAWARPDVVWFGEMLPEGALEAALAAARECDVFLSIGTSGLVEPAASLPFAALESGATVIEVNPDPTPLTRHVIALAGKSGEVLPEIIAT